MALSRKRKRELKKLRAHTESLLDQQRDVLQNAGVVFSEATRQAKQLGSEELMPRVNKKLDAVRPQVERNLATMRRASDRVKVAVAPVVATALAKTVTALDNIDARNAAQQVEQFGRDRGILKKPRRSRVGIFAIGVGVVAAAAVGVALWQAFRDEDDDMWVSSED
ncbi:MAG TPA: DNA/RNA helicase [Microbacteriaceae bacterium]|nr:DNA/RNA helicase [Microbacteriaceae bacterium]